MNAVTIGPLAMSTDRFAIILGVLVFVVVASLAARKIAPRLGPWSSFALLAGFIGARGWHVARHLDSFMQEPWRIIAFWQGGFEWIGGVAGIGLAILALATRDKATLPWAGLSLAAGGAASMLVLGLAGANATPAAFGEPLQTLDGRTVSISSRNGRPAVINLWATWCPPCRREMPGMAVIANRRTELDFIFANQGEAAPGISDYLQKNGIKVDNVVLDPVNGLSRHYGAPGLPVTLLIAPDGRLVSSHFGEISPEVLSEKIDTLVRQSADGKQNQ